MYQRQISKSSLAEVMEAGAGSAQTTVKFSSEELKVIAMVSSEFSEKNHDVSLTVKQIFRISIDFVWRHCVTLMTYLNVTALKSRFLMK